MSRYTRATLSGTQAKPGAEQALGRFGEGRPLMLSPFFSVRPSIAIQRFRLCVPDTLARTSWESKSTSTKALFFCVHIGSCRMNMWHQQTVSALALLDVKCGNGTWYA